MTTMRVGRIPYINCYPVYGAIDRGVVSLNGELVDGVPTELNRQMAAGTLDVSVISAVEYARDAKRYLLLPDLSICSDGPVRSVVLFSKRPASELHGRRVLVSRSSMTSVALLELLFTNVWDAKTRVRAERRGARGRRPLRRRGARRPPRHRRRRAASLVSPACARIGHGRPRAQPIPVRVRPRRRMEGVDRVAVRVRPVGRAAYGARRIALWRSMPA